ncbi:MAG: TIGR00730 family Rossman fold protein [Ilumatobacteraceae bacterium]|nr:MAG: TIGR00730 family Rossman fold protein [Actinomycetota bacterium]
MSHRLSVYCGSNVGSSPVYAETAARLGASLAAREIGLVYGGGNVGLMGVLADAVLAGGGSVTGVIPEHLVRAEVAHRGLTELIVVSSMHDRKACMSDLADGFVVLPGGFGTLDETFEALTWGQLGLQSKPVVLLDVEGFFDPLLAMMDRAVDAGFLRPAHRMLAQRARTVDEALALALGPAPPTPHKWLDRDGPRLDAR